MARIINSIVVVALLGIVVGCSSDGNSPETVGDAQSASATTQLPENDFSDSSTQALNEDGSTNSRGAGNLLPVLFATQTDLDLDYAKAGVELIEQVSNGFILPADIDVIFADCGVANAFYVSGIANREMPDQLDTSDQIPRSAGGSIIMCHELTQLFASFYNDKDQAVSASIFVLMHELGHALVNQLSLPVLGIEESYVDGMGAVFVGEAGMSEGAVLAGWFFGSQTETPFFDSHRAGPQRLGDLACWGVGSNPLLADDPIIGNISQQLMNGGRNCAGEYAQQLAGLTSVLEPHLRTSLQELFGNR